jgi:hypothetical protein
MFLSTHEAPKRARNPSHQTKPLKPRTFKPEAHKT